VVGDPNGGVEPESGGGLGGMGPGRGGFLGGRDGLGGRWGHGGGGGKFAGLGRMFGVSAPKNKLGPRVLKLPALTSILGHALAPGFLFW